MDGAWYDWSMTVIGTVVFMVVLGVMESMEQVIRADNTRDYEDSRKILSFIREESEIWLSKFVWFQSLRLKS